MSIPHRILRVPSVEDATGLRRSRIYELERRGEFPARVRISERAAGWYAAEIEEWLASRPRASAAPADRAKSNLCGTVTSLPGDGTARKATRRIAQPSAA